MTADEQLAQLQAERDRPAKQPHPDDVTRVREGMDDLLKRLNVPVYDGAHPWLPPSPRRSTP